MSSKSPHCVIEIECKHTHTHTHILQWSKSTLEATWAAHKWRKFHVRYMRYDGFVSWEKGQGRIVFGYQQLCLTLGRKLCLTLFQNRQGAWCAWTKVGKSKNYNQLTLSTASQWGANPGQIVPPKAGIITSLSSQKTDEGKPLFLKLRYGTNTH